MGLPVGSNVNYRRLLELLPNPRGTMSLEELLEVKLFGGLLDDIVPDHLSEERLSTNCFDLDVLFNTVSVLFKLYFCVPSI